MCGSQRESLSNCTLMYCIFIPLSVMEMFFYVLDVKYAYLIALVFT